MTKDEALRMALEALENHSGNYKLTKDECVKYRAIEDAIKEALAQRDKDIPKIGCVNHDCDKCRSHSDQEPVAWMYPDALCDKACLYLCTKGFTQFPECATPPQRKPLTDEQKEVLEFLDGIRPLDGVWFGEEHPTQHGGYWWRKHLRRVFNEAAHGIKE